MVSRKLFFREHVKFLKIYYLFDNRLETNLKDKGVYWKGADFWNKDAYYNMCLPQL